MATEAFKEAVRLLARTPLLWVPGIVAGLFAAALWVLVNVAGIFFASRLIVIFGLILLFFITGLFVVIRNNGGDTGTMIRGALQQYFRVLVPQLVILFAILVIFILLMVTFGFTGITPDPQFLAILTFCVMLPTLMLTFFFDVAAVLEDRKVFESIHRSIALVTENMMEVIAFYIVCALTCFAIIFPLMIVWEAALFDKLEPVTHYTEAQLQAFTPEKLIAMIGPDGIWITAGVLFVAGLLIIPVIYTYKTCFFKKISSAAIPVIQQTSGEYDSKGRWYKY